MTASAQVATAARGATTSPRLTLSRTAFLVPAVVAMLAGLDAAMMMIDLPAPVDASRLPEVHGFLLVLGFVGTLVSLERAVALGTRAGLAAPALLGIGALLLVSPAPLAVGRATLLAGAISLTLVYVPLWRRQRDDAVLIQAGGAVLAVGAAALWLGGVAVPALLPWLVGFVVLTIAGERVDLARLTIGSTAPALALATVFMGAVLATLLWPTVGYPLAGVVLVVLVCWFAANDVARRTVNATGLPRFSAACMLGGYLWLGVAGSIWMLGGAALDGVRYDAVVHAVFLGWTMSMIIAHAPVILPAVLRRPLPYHPALWAPAGLLHLSLALRLWAGDGLGSPTAWRIGGTLNIASLLLFAGTAVWLSVTAARTGRSRQ